MQRKEFIVTIMTAAGLMPLVITQIGCSTSTEPRPTTTSNGYLFTSSVNSGHSHTVEIKITDLSQPPEGGRTLSTSSTGHTHSVTLSQSDFVALEASETLVRSTTSNSGHLHTFTFTIADAEQSSGDSNYQAT